VNVHVREKTILVQCGDGAQKIQWLASVGFARYDHNNGLELGQPVRSLAKFPLLSKIRVLTSRFLLFLRS